jgi:hypothetical protein
VLTNRARELGYRAGFDDDVRDILLERLLLRPPRRWFKLQVVEYEISLSRLSVGRD